MYVNSGNRKAQRVFYTIPAFRLEIERQLKEKKRSQSVWCNPHHLACFQVVFYASLKKACETLLASFC